MRGALGVARMGIGRNGSLVPTWTFAQWIIRGLDTSSLKARLGSGHVLHAAIHTLVRQRFFLTNQCAPPCIANAANAKRLPLIHRA